MKKLRLDLDDLAVESFDTTQAQREKGTVFGEQCTCQTACTCPGCPTCYDSCNGTCGDTCAASCNGTCDYSCGGTCYEWTCGYDCGTINDGTCQNYGTCHWNSPCQPIP